MESSYRLVQRPFAGAFAIMEHTVKSFEQELQRLSSLISQMGGIAEAQLKGALDALVRRDMALAARVMAGDQQLDEHERTIEQNTVHMLALRQPMAIDLREILAALKISTDLERIGDLAANIAKRATALAQLPPVALTGSVPRMGHIVEEMLRDVLDAYIDRDVAKAVGAWQRDRDLDQLYSSLFQDILALMMEDPRNSTPCAHLLFIAKNLERAGDHATNVAETVYFLVKGTNLPGSRPKGDETSFTIVSPASAHAS